ncbi:MAG: hypothetical protein RMJ44_08265 [Cytophagales bacterium]|nr:hypothetical protein [Bernardetiaceae bacterium]MDW8211067.1 hypothetical protein [Cytophagales bacterium]
MKKFIVALLLVMLSISITPQLAQGQCAMCRATVENNISNGTSRVGRGLNTGILYLMSIPYLAFAVIAYLWYQQSKAQRAKKMMIEQRLRNAGVRFS